MRRGEHALEFLLDFDGRRHWYEAVQNPKPWGFEETNEGCRTR
jgi:hypothetical protein